jgi:hypothetical protein
MNDNLLENEDVTNENIGEKAADTSSNESNEQDLATTNESFEEVDENIVHLTDNEVNNGDFISVSNPAKALFEDTKFSEKISEIDDDQHEEFHEIPTVDYDTLSMEKLIDELGKLLKVEKIIAVKAPIENIKLAFLSKFHHFIDEKKEAFALENENPEERFEYFSPLKSQFDQLYNAYRNKLNQHYKSLESDLKSNLDARLSIIEELKKIINPEESVKDALKTFNELRERWKNAGPIPKDKYNHVWNNFHFHVENFYDYLHLDRAARDQDFKHNLELKEKIILRAQELVKYDDINKAFYELQDLHKIWKEEIGPVSREFREEIWNRFSALSKEIHDKRDGLLEEFKKREVDNLEKKREIINQIVAICNENTGNSAWQSQVSKVEALRNLFFETGKVPSQENEATWSAFKEAVRKFNLNKNAHFKEIKKEQQENLNKKMELIAKANELKNSDDFDVSTPLMKQIQEDWKKIGHVPRKVSDSIWKEFKDACNYYFDRLKESRKKEDATEIEAFDKKKEYLETTMKEVVLSGDHKTDLATIKSHIEAWKNMGRVPNARRHIDGKFNKILDDLFEKLTLSKKDSEMMRFSNRMSQLSEGNDTRKIENEKVFLTKKIQEIQNEIFQLENNIQFFQNAKNNGKENSIVTEVKKNIEKHREELSLLKEKLAQVKEL